MSRRNLTDSQAIARYLVQLFTDQQMGATGALLLDENGALPQQRGVRHI